MRPSALRRFFIVSRSWRRHTPRTPAGEIECPRARIVDDADLAEGGLLQRELKNAALDLGRGPVGQQRLRAGQLLQGEFAARLVEFLEAVEAVTRGAHQSCRLGSRCRAAWPAPAGRAWRG